MQLSIFYSLAKAKFVGASFDARVLKKELVGSNGLEPSTSRLSGVCSNQLSYEPMWWR